VRLGKSLRGAQVRVAMLHRDIVPEHSCDGHLISLEKDLTYIRFVICSLRRTEFAIVPDSDWVTVVQPGMRNARGGANKP